MGCGCHGASAMVGLGTMGGLVNECDAPFQIVLSAEKVDQLRARLMPIFEATALAIRECAGLSRDDRVTWEDFFAHWRNHVANDEVNWWNASANWDKACSFSRDLEGWQNKVRNTSCVVPGPDLPPPPTTTSDVLGTLKWVAAAAGIVAIVYGIRTVLR